MGTMSSHQQAHTPADSRESTTDVQNPTDPTAATPQPSVTDAAPLPPDATVLATPRGGQYHQPLGQSRLPKCGARAGGSETAERMTRYRAEEDENLDTCSSCFANRGE